MAKDNHSIDLARAVALTERWRKNHPKAIKAGKFDRIAFDRLLAQPDAAGIRIYLGEKEDGAWTYVMVATTAEGKDIIPGRRGVAARESAEEGTGIEDQSENCPEVCDCESPINGECPPP